MRIPIHFPTQAEKLVQEVREYRDQTPEERLRVVFELSAFCEAIRVASPRAAEQTRLLDEEEEREHRAWRGLLSRHGGTAT